MPFYPVQPPNPISQDNLEICQVPAGGATLTQISLLASDIASLVPPVVVLTDIGFNTLQFIELQSISGTLGLYDSTNNIDLSTRQKIRDHLAADLYGTANAAGPAGLASSNDGMPGYAEEAAWVCFVTGGASTGLANLAAGNWETDAGKFAWTAQVWSEAWQDAVNGGWIPVGSTWDLHIGSFPSAPALWIVGYGFDVVTDIDRITNAFTALINVLSGWIPAIEYP